MKKLCKLVMLPTDYADNAILVFNGQYKFAEYHENQYFTQQYVKSIGTVSYFLYILSNDKIEVNDWCYDSKENRIIKNQYFPENIPNTRKKVIASNSPSSKFSDLPKLPISFLQHYAIEYSKHNMIIDVKVDYEEYHGINTSIAEINSVSGDGSMNWKGINDLRDSRPLVNPKTNTIIITVPKPVVYTKEKVRELCLKAIQHGKKIQAFHQSGMGPRYAPISENQWLIDNL